jgi:uncharacterized membrane protein YkvI
MGTIDARAERSASNGVIFCFVVLFAGWVLSLLQILTWLVIQNTDFSDGGQNPLANITISARGWAAAVAPCVLLTVAVLLVGYRVSSRVPSRAKMWTGGIFGVISFGLLLLPYLAS